MMGSDWHLCVKNVNDICMTIAKLMNVIKELWRMLGKFWCSIHVIQEFHQKSRTKILAAYVSLKTDKWSETKRKSEVFRSEIL